ncbi:MAG TPA: DUF2007 domain-containing protein [Solirubrobacterales bacterium]|nr:DUF2007 domain-containing protein [Solirubrobacterales bacterium]
MSPSTSHKPPPSGRQHGAHGGGNGDAEGGGGGGGGNGERMVKVAFARTQPEAEMLQGLLTEVGIPSMLKRSAGFDNPEFLPNGPRDVLVRADSAKLAREVLADVMVEDEAAELEAERRLARGETGVTPPARLAFWVIAVGLGGVLVAWLLYQAA